VFHIHDRNNEDSYIAPVHYDSASHWMLQALESAIEIEYVMIENRKRESELKINALKKLTEEERRVLGLV
jgi:FixJ family two-component response regulator